MGPRGIRLGSGKGFHNEEHGLIHLPNTVSVIKCKTLTRASHVTKMEKSGGSLKILTGKLTGKIPLGMSKLRWENNITMDLKQVSVRGIGLIRVR